MSRFCSRCKDYIEDGNFKQCDLCRAKNREESKRKYDRDRRIDVMLTERKRKTKEWTQEKWEAFVRSGGLEGL